MQTAVAVGLAVLALGACARPSWLKLPSVDMPDMPSVKLPSLGEDEATPEPARISEVEVVESADVTDFYARATEFYDRLEGRRFNSVASFRDAGLREYFESDQSFTDYYADLADDLATANFERSVPLDAEVRGVPRRRARSRPRQDRTIDGRGRPAAPVLVHLDSSGRIAGSGAPGSWWIVPGKP